MHTNPAAARAGTEREESRPAVTAVVCTRNRPEFLPEALQGLAVRLRPDDELVVVESGDSRGAEALRALDSDVRIVHLRSEIPGKSHKLNRAIAVARGEVVMITDDDARVDAGWVDAMAAPFQDPRVGIAFGPVEGLTHHGDEPLPALRPGEAPLLTWLYAHGVAMGVRVVAARHVGGFDERLGPGAPAHGEEHDLLIRLWERGWHAVIADAPPVAHLDWRNPEEERTNLLVYERGGGALLGAALRRHPIRWARLAALRGRYQLETMRSSPMGWATVRAFVGGLVYGLRLDERRWL
ncbi:MAG: glycosyltransferase [Acidimicrobiales bacterium]